VRIKQRFDAYIVLEPPTEDALRGVALGDRPARMREVAAEKAGRLFEQLQHQGLGKEITRAKGYLAEEAPPNFLVVRGTERALDAARRVEGVVAVAKADTPIPLGVDGARVVQAASVVTPRR
jgi:hypothetical protein